jgi:hypothetical protein
MATDADPVAQPPQRSTVVSDHLPAMPLWDTLTFDGAKFHAEGWSAVPGTGLTEKGFASGPIPSLKSDGLIDACGTST